MVNTNAMLYGMMAGQQVGQYHLESLLGAGGFGGVFRANEVVRDRVLRQVAVKVIPGNDEQQLEELLAAETLEHDHLVRCYAAGECSLLNIEALYLAMELAEGSLDSHLQGKTLKTEEIRQIIGDVASGLAYLHSQNQVHRDLKPANVLRVRERWKLSDFGLVRHLGTNSYAQTANPIGTIAYMPPEAFEGRISAAWDIWSLGIMVVQMVSQNLPYRFSEPTQLLKQVMNGAIELPTLPEDFRPIVEGCLQVNRGDRWDVKQVLEALRPQPPGSQNSPPQVPLQYLKERILQAVVSPPRALTTIRESLRGGRELELIQLPAGKFMMGAPDSDKNANRSEKPQHPVKVKAFAIGKYPITQAQYEAVMGENPSIKKGWFQTDKQSHPVDCVSWDKAKEFCQKLSQKTGKKYRLPSEAEWEYACRAGTKTLYYFGDNANQLGEYAWYGDNSNGQTHPVGTKKPNVWGLYDMHGNVYEWCEDRWHDNYHRAPVKGNPWTEGNDDKRVLRGGSWSFDLRSCRSSCRYGYDPVFKYFNLGFRVVVSL